MRNQPVSRSRGRETGSETYREIGDLLWNDHRMPQQHKGRGIVTRIGRRVRRAVQGADPAPAAPPPNHSASTPEVAGVRPGSAQELRGLREEVTRARADLRAANEERTALKAERLALQQRLGEQHGKRVLPRLKVEKTNGVASFVVGARMMQRVHARAEDPQAGLDGAGTVFADAARTEAFARSHGVTCPVRFEAEPDVIVHAFKGDVPLVELREGGRVRHVTPEGTDPGDVRPGVRYSTEIAVPGSLEDLLAASETLSAHLPRPYVQIGWNVGSGTPVLTGVDASPDRVPVFDAEWDARLGKAFDAAHARMLMQPHRVGALANRAPDGIFRYEEGV